jgi:hypothetical protein
MRPMYFTFLLAQNYSKKSQNERDGFKSPYAKSLPPKVVEESFIEGFRFRPLTCS